MSLLINSGLAVCLAVLAMPAAGRSYDAVKQFQTVTNTDTNRWSYRATDGQGHDGRYALLTGTGTQAAYRHHRPFSLPDWNTAGAQFNIPLFAASRIAGPIKIRSNALITVPGRTLILHPGNSGVGAVLSFHVPTSGSATITYEFTHLDWTCIGYGQGIAWSIEKNSGGGALASGHLLSTDAQHVASTGVQQLMVSVARHDRINFIVDPVSNPPNCDLSGLSAVVSLP